jgi:LemA protein
MEPFEFFIGKRALFQLVSAITIAVIIGGFLLAYHWSYHSIADLDRQADERWVQVTRDLQERYGGIPGLVGYLGTSPVSGAPALGEVTRNLSAWREAMAEGGMGSVNPATANLEASLANLGTVLAGHPDIETSPQVQEYRATLRETGEQIPADRSAYNDAIGAYNREIGSFPASLWAYNWGFGLREYFTAAIGGAEPAPGPAG